MIFFDSPRAILNVSLAVQISRSWVCRTANRDPSSVRANFQSWLLALSIRPRCDHQLKFRHGYIQRWYNSTTLYNNCRFKSCISKKRTNTAVTKNVVTSIAIQHMLVKCCTPTFSYNILFNKVVNFCSNQHQSYKNIFENCMQCTPQQPTLEAVVGCFHPKQL